MKKLIIGLLLIAQYQLLVAQGVGVGTTSPHPSAQLDVTSITKGLLIPRMTGAQRVAIGTPASGLLVYQTNTEIIPSSSPGFYIYDAGAWKRIARADEIASSTSWTVSGSNQYSNVSGNVGIGINSPNASAKLDISSTTGGLLVPRMSIGQRYDIPNPATGLIVYDTDLKEFWYYDGTVWQGLLNSKYDYWNRSSSSNRHWVYNLTDSIGIGTTSPDEKLQVIGNVKTSGDVDAGGEVAGSSFRTPGTLTVGGNSVLGGNLTATGYITALGTITSNTSMVINDPSAILTLKSSSVDKGFMQLSGDDVRLGTFSSNNLGNLNLRVNGTNTLNITPSLNVGIGTESPSSKLHVMGRIFANGNGEVLKLDGVNPNMAFYQNGTYRSFISQSGTELFVGVNGGNLHLDAAQVAIGNVVTAASAYKLTVAGKIICEELKVKLQSSGWPDYVFDNSYKLPALNDVEKFIAQNKHLPNIPSAAYVDKNGIEVGDMQKRMMEKIEELTLYIIQQQKDIELLKTQIKKAN